MREYPLTCVNRFEHASKMPSGSAIRRRRHRGRREISGVL